MKTLKELRIWHWLQFLRYRRIQRLHEQKHGVERANQARDIAQLHLSAVEVLNDALPGTTVEADYATQYNPDGKYALVG